MPIRAIDSSDRGRDLLFGVIALQMSFIDQALFFRLVAEVRP